MVSLTDKVVCKTWDITVEMALQVVLPLFCMFIKCGCFSSVKFGLFYIYQFIYFSMLCGAVNCTACLTSTRSPVTDLGLSLHPAVSILRPCYGPASILLSSLQLSRDLLRVALEGCRMCDHYFKWCVCLHHPRIAASPSSVRYSHIPHHALCQWKFPLLDSTQILSTVTLPPPSKHRSNQYQVSWQSVWIFILHALYLFLLECADKCQEWKSCIFWAFWGWILESLQ